jgi:hypothetical protein
MKRVKIILITIAIVSAVSVAFSTRPCVLCEYEQQYYKVGSSYFEAGIYGDNYICWNIPGVCTYYRPNPGGLPDYYVPCRNGVYEGE